MMADALVDPALFRLRAFEVEWLAPLKIELSDLYDRSVEFTLTRRWTAESDGTALLLYVLIAEADRWLTVGQQVGYFAQTSPSTHPLSLAEPPELQSLLSAIRSQAELPPGLGIREFARALGEARDDLTAERREFLRLVCFAEEEEWLERLNQIRALAEELADRPEEFPPSEMVDGVTWGLDAFGRDISGNLIHPPAESGRAGSETSAAIELQHHLPAEWRSGSLALVSKQSPVTRRRLAALAEVRASIAATIKGITQIQHPVGPSRSGAVAGFGIDTTARSTGEALRDWRARVRGGQLGSLPAWLGLIGLVIVFSVASDSFLTLGNIANLLAQGAGVTIIAMGLVFVLLLGEIDLSAGTASGVTAAILALHLVSGGNLLGRLGLGVFVVFCVLLVLAIGIGIQLRIWAASAAPAIALAMVLVGVGPNPWLAMLLAVCVGTSIGLLTGFLVSRIGIPSFVVTLALFLAWQGVILQLIGAGGTVGLREDTLFAVANGNLSVVGSWVLFLLAAGGFGAVVLGRHYRRLHSGLVTQPTPLVFAKVGVTVALAAVGTYLLTRNRSQRALIEISGVPYVVPIVLVLLVAGTYVLDRTSYGRHIYAVGGNAEAARRAGINVPRIRASVFVISASLAAVGAIVYSSKVGSVDPSAGGGTTLLFAVGAAVIGGTSLFGGRGRLSNAVIGGAVLAMVGNGLGLLRQPAAVILVVTGLVLLLAASVDALSRRRDPGNR